MIKSLMSWDFLLKNVSFSKIGQLFSKIFSILYRYFYNTKLRELDSSRTCHCDKCVTGIQSSTVLIGLCDKFSPRRDVNSVIIPMDLLSLHSTTNGGINNDGCIPGGHEKILN
jgi:hypothetical protein